MCFAPSRPKRDVVILGLTGAIGAGKSVAARMFLYEGAAVFDADDAVRGLIGGGGVAVAAVEAAFPGCGEDGPGGRGIDRAALARRVFGDGEATDSLENILHPLVHEAEAGFLCRAAARRARLAVLEVPLLFETGGDRRCDAVAVVWAPTFVRARRVLKRPGMTPKLFAAIRARQMPADDKLRRADFVIPAGIGRAVTLRRVRRIVRMLDGCRGLRWPPRPLPRR